MDFIILEEPGSENYPPAKVKEPPIQGNRMVTVRKLGIRGLHSKQLRDGGKFLFSQDIITGSAIRTRKKGTDEA